MQPGDNLARSRRAKERDLVATLGICVLVAVQGIDHRPETTCPTSQGSLRSEGSVSVTAGSVSCLVLPSSIGCA